MQDLGIISPGLEEFRELAATRRVIPVHLKVLADAETPIGLYRKLAQGQPGTFLMESAAVGGAWSRYSFIGAKSRATLTTKDGNAHWLGQPPAGVPLDGNPVEAVRDTIAALQTERFEGLPPFTSGMVGFIGWESVRHWERLTSPPEDDLHLPELALNLVTDMAVHDNVDGTVMLIANAINFDDTSERVDDAWHDAVKRIRSLLERVAEPVRQPVSVLDTTGPDFAASVQERWDENEYLAALDRGKEAIVDGEVFQVVISRRFEMECGASPLDVYRVLRNTNPSPYMYIFSLADADGREYSIVGSSPEALVTVTGDDVITHPIAGSRPRGKSVEADKAMAEELLADQKERAEHLMLVDLSRNDLSKVCVAGSVDVSQFMEVERFSHIMHLVSTVVGKLAPGASAYDVLKATFPAGTLSGAPKPRALRLLDELEPHRRGIYGGVVGYLDFAGDMDMAIAIRSALLREGRAYVQAGGGIVADSSNPAEALETVNKAAAPLRAVHTAGSLHDITAESVVVQDPATAEARGATDIQAAQ
ncbi:anthranilate synthase component I [Pseudarthrobacter sp. J75]|uniref:anthranilate synthase component I n=1 Tax=unclassified Pseudarthrobacter TaxID=2647000 RepID=UPI002E80574C|nr:MULTISPECIES: anthranilate synthase component I [unclassified Pseudarthrobacter]MEE2522651.1 anthranilate synthase component I [Pseudarthrobacter sp. J47]MEE2529512.1 anthranilate synthase component I [Pseudarthrobacter sp. J75]MEE2569720.1 anthranilate synthase component I [Pseudarthrobacter sp. J64]